MMHGDNLAHPTRSPPKSIAVLDATYQQHTTARVPAGRSDRSTKLKIIVNMSDVSVGIGVPFVGTPTDNFETTG